MEEAKSAMALTPGRVPLWVEETLRYDLIHVAPPHSAPDFVKLAEAYGATAVPLTDPRRFAGEMR